MLLLVGAGRPGPDARGGAGDVWLGRLAVAVQHRSSRTRRERAEALLGMVRGESVAEAGSRLPGINPPG